MILFLRVFVWSGMVSGPFRLTSLAAVHLLLLDRLDEVTFITCQVHSIAERLGTLRPRSLHKHMNVKTI